MADGGGACRRRQRTNHVSQSFVEAFRFRESSRARLAPAPDYQPGDSPNNNDSLVLELSFGKHRVLMTGDAERPVEDELVASGELRPVTLLKVGHHGSKSSSSEEF